MKVINETLSIIDFNAWRGAEDTKKTILKHNKSDDFEHFINELYPDGLTDINLNDLLWFESDFIFENIGIDQEED